MKNIIMLIFLGLLLCTACFAGPQIHLQSATFDPLDNKIAAVQPVTPSEIGPDAKRYYIVQFQGPITEEWKTEALAAGAELLEYVPDFAFIVRAKDEAVAKLRAMTSVRWIGDYAPEYRLSKDLALDGSADVVISLFPGADGQYIKNKVAALHGNANPKLSATTIRAKLPVTSLIGLAGTAGISWIEPAPKYRFLNDVARNIMTVNNAWEDVGLYGAGQTVAVCDTGLDNGVNNATLHADFRGRLLKAYALGRPNDWSDDMGHGTHTAGSVCGNGALSGSNPLTHSYTSSFAGVAPEASLVFQSIMGADEYSPPGVPTDLNELFNPTYQDGARVHSNSWGSGDPFSMGAYTTDSYNVDLFIWNHKDFLICFAAGNSGMDGFPPFMPADGIVDGYCIGAPATAKNCITVGATESLKSCVDGSMPTWSTIREDAAMMFSAEPICSDPVADNASGMAAFSSRGPTNDGRTKPDICSPGVNIVSCRAHDPAAQPGEGAYDDNYMYATGTSMSTPLTAGACVLVREYYTKKNITPSAALIKATLLNGAFDMTPGQYGWKTPTVPWETKPRPNSVEGWGRLDLKNSIIPPSPRNVFSMDPATGLSTNGTTTYSFYAISNTTPLKATLVWSDYPSATAASKNLVNDLDLTITGPTGTVYRGNGGTSADRTNNVESVDIKTPGTGTYTITVKGYNVPHGPQPYALVVSGAVTNVNPTAITTIADLKSRADGIVVRLTGKSVSAGSDQLKGRFYIEETDRSSGIRVQFGPGGGPTISPGQVVSVTGTLTTVDGERMLIDPIVY